ncbi:SusC/RagA family TonB-linked outer membrane protein [Maribacter sp. X9]|uniref:SusC/RagA family TonB-linked outer membrane protein n=1 Tax=Maribacter sp. X9 TaxID=3402159 RepID=UPI003AF3E0A5
MRKMIKIPHSGLFKPTLRFLLVLVAVLMVQNGVFAMTPNMGEAPGRNQIDQRSIQGKVMDIDGQPLPGVNVLVKGDSQGTMTNFDGDFSLEVPSDAKILVFTYLGMKTKEVAIDQRTSYNITMEMEAVGLDEFVAVGYGSQSKRSLTTSVSKLDDKVLENVPFTNAATALKGTLAGLKVQSTSGQPGATPNIVIRGGTSINSPNSANPIFIIDGVTRYNMDDINAADIESVQVLKDAASTAIYGALGSNGVIIVETKSGKSGKVQVNYRTSMTLAETSRRYDLLSARDFVYYSRKGLYATSQILPSIAAQLDGSVYAGGTGNDLTNNTYSSLQFLTPENAYKLDEGWQSMPDPLDPSKTLIFSDTDYQDLLFRTAVSTDHSLSVSGGGEKTAFHLGLGFSDNQGVAIQTDYKRYTLNLSGEIDITDKIKAYAKVLYSNVKNKQVHNLRSVFRDGLIQPPTNKLYFEDGTLAPGRNFSYANPLYSLSVNNPRNLSNDLTLIVGGHFDITKDLSFEPQFSWKQRTDYSRNFTEAYWNGTASYNTTRSASTSVTQRYSPQINGVFKYTKNFNDHNLSLMAGFSYLGTDIDQVSATGNGAATDLIPTLNGSAIPTAVFGQETHHVLLGYFSRATYNYKQKYLLGASLRYDGASNLGEKNKWGVFPGISAGWNVDKEDFWTNMLPENLIQLKLRASYGVTGNISGLGYYQAQGEYASSAKYDTNSALQISVLPNPDLKWEQSKTLDFGVDLGMFNRRVDVMFDYYRRVSDNLLTTLNMPPSSGFDNIITNYGSLENKGFEIGINAHLLPYTSDFQWNVSFNTAKVDTRILKLPPNGVENNRVGGNLVWDAKLGDYAWKGGLQEGGRIGDLYGYQQVGVYATDEEAAAGPVDMLIPREDKTKSGGDVNWLDADNNGIIDTRDMVYMGNQYPDFTGGFSNRFEYKNLSLSLRLDYSLGGTVYYETGARLEGNFSGANAISSSVLNSWENQGDITNQPKYYWADQNANWNVWNSRGSSRFFQKTDYLSIREVTLAYTLPSSISEKISLDNVRFHITGSNLHYFTKYDGLNPEVTDSDVGYPIPRELILGLSINF